MNLKDNFSTLKFLYTHCKLSVETLKAIQKNQDTIDLVKLSEDFFNSASLSRSLSSQIFRYSIIQYSSFLDEYKLFNVSLEDEFKERILNVRKKNSWGLKMINTRWPDLQNYRNNIIAHNLKINGKSFFSNYENKVYQYKVPGNIEEQELFISILEKICSNIYYEFENILQETNFYSQNIESNLKIIVEDNFWLKEEISEIEKNMN